MTDAEIIAFARAHLDAGLCHDRAARITRATDAELLAFARAVLEAEREEHAADIRNRK